MNKRKVILITVTFDNGETDTFEVDATMSESINARKKYGYSNLQEWVEYHITWIEYVRDLPAVSELVKAVEKEDREALRGKAWCSQHQMEPGECFKLHNVAAYSGRDVDFVKAVEKEINKTISELKSKASLYPEFSLDDLLEGYGNGRTSTNPGRP